MGLRQGVNMSFLHKLQKVLGYSALGYMSKAELKDKLPELYVAYESVYGGKKPDIQIVAADTFSFPAEQFSMGSWHHIFAVKDGQVKEINVAEHYGHDQPIPPDSMVFDCITGNLQICKLYVHPQNAAPLLKPATDITDEEKIALCVMKGMKPFAREEEYYSMKYGFTNTHKARRDHPTEYKDTIKSLAAKGLVKVNAAGSAMLTLEGKNRAVQSGDVVKKYRGY
jgi:hypothetical protein